jgi:23S rRNA (adenine2503-C2)-methyltransferase
MGFEKYRAKQIFDWLYKSRINSLNEMRNMPKNIVEKLKINYDVFLPEIIKETKSETDETKKCLLKLKDGNRIECVLIYSGERITLCASTQVGCACACRFCSTATLGFKRNLDAGEIVSQIMLAMKMTDNKLTNVVFMGMGEPLLNWNNLRKAILILSDKNGVNFSQTRITVSTAGIVPVIKEIAESGLKINLAISLITADDEIRSKLMPINLKYPLKEIISAAEYYNKKKDECITFEYVLFGGINDGEKDAINLAEKLRKVNYKVNLIPYNDSLNKEFIKPNESKVKNFQKILMDNGIKVFIRKEKGADIKAACGQLAAED